MRVIVYDATDTSPAPELADAWRTGADLYKAIGRFDRIFGAVSWAQALSFLRGAGRMDEIHYWGHGSPGRVWLGGRALAVSDLEGIDVRALFWLRTCASFQGPVGQQLAEMMAATLGCKVAGHTYNIGLWQAGLHTLLPTERAYWSVKDGLGRDGRTRWSYPWSPRGVTCLHNSIPGGW